MPNNISFDRDRIRASIYKESFYEFMRGMWSEVIPETPVWNWHIKFLCDELQIVAERIFRNEPKKYDLIINVPPGSTKSTICSVMFPSWVWTRMPSFRSMCASYSFHLANDLSRKSRDVTKSDLYQRLFPEITIRSDQDTKAYFANTDGGIRYAVGTGGSITGMHGHALIGDDLIDPQMASSDADIKSSNEWLSETFSSRKVNKAVTPLILIMQRLHQNDSTAFRLNQRSAGPVRHICLPAELNENVKPTEVRDFYGKRGLLDIKRLPRSVLKQSLGELGEFGYAGQMLQNPVPRGGAMFKVDNLTITDTVPKLRETVRFWDKAGTKGGGAYTVGVKMAIDYDGNYWVLDVVRGQWEAYRRESMIEQMAHLDGISVRVGVEQEPGAAGKESAQNTIKRLAGYKVQGDPATGDKETRADTFASQVNGGTVFLKRGPWNAEYVEELRYFPRSTYKDQVDASSGAFAMLSRIKLRVGAF